MDILDSLVIQGETISESTCIKDEGKSRAKLENLFTK
jgi:hypothetical protein